MSSIIKKRGTRLFYAGTRAASVMLAAGLLVVLAPLPAAAMSCDAAAREFAKQASMGLQNADTLASLKKFQERCRSGEPSAASAEGADTGATASPQTLSPARQLQRRAEAQRARDASNRRGIEERKQQQRALRQESREPADPAPEARAATTAAAPAATRAAPASGPKGSSQIPVPAAVRTASCQGTMGFLAPALYDYPDPLLKNLRTTVLNLSIPEQLQAVRNQTRDTGHAIQVLTNDVRETDRAAATARKTADDTDGRGFGVSTGEVDNNRLSFALQCHAGAAIHTKGLCEYINQRTMSLVRRTLIELIQRC
ncbi:MAG: hypothetical protein GX772_08580 [Alcaligenaceae bacterium]|nr:hypothetical protein [Alcaligenaceae bacterium]